MIIREVMIWLNGHLLALAVNAHWFFHVTYFLGFVFVEIFLAGEIEKKSSRQTAISRNHSQKKINSCFVAIANDSSDINSQ